MVDTINTTTSTSYKTNNIILIINVILRLWYDYNLGMLDTIIDVIIKYKWLK